MKQRYVTGNDYFNANLSEHYPLKQGLKQRYKQRDFWISISFRTLSTKTRIETFVSRKLNILFVFLSEHYPLKQGLKHDINGTITSTPLSLSEHYPLKQGLKLRCIDYDIRNGKFLSEHYPLKQGLKPYAFFLFLFAFYALSEHYPLKQGLKQSCINSSLWRSYKLSEHYPLKQGLKPIIPACLNAFAFSFRTLSTKTRIETFVIGKLFKFTFFFQNIIH